MEEFKALMNGVFVWALCEIIKYYYLKIKAHFYDDPAKVPPQTNIKIIVGQYHLSLLVIILLFLTKKNLSVASNSIYNVLFAIFTFLNLSAFECLREMAEYFKGKFADKNGDDSN